MEYAKLLEKKTRYTNGIIGLLVFATVVLAGTALLLAGLQYGEVNNHTSPKYIYSDTTGYNYCHDRGHCRIYFGQ